MSYGAIDMTNEDDIRLGLPKIFDLVPEEVIRVVEAQIMELLKQHPELNPYHAAMHVACQFASNK